MLRIVLAQTTEPGNIGSVCRAMANFDVPADQLYLVDVQCDPLSDKAVSRAGQAHARLRALRCVDTLDEAFAGCCRTVATTSLRDRFRSQAAGLPRNEMPRLWRLASASAPVALLLGTEPSGLTHQQLLSCDELLTIPTSQSYGSLNLSVSVAILCYEWSLVAAEQVGPAVCASAQPPGELPLEDQPPDAPLMQVLFDQLCAAAERIGFFNPQNPLPLQYAFRRILSRAVLTRQEAQVVIGLARQLRWSAEHGLAAPSPPPSAVPSPPPSAVPSDAARVRSAATTEQPQAAAADAQPREP